MVMPAVSWAHQDDDDLGFDLLYRAERFLGNAAEVMRRAETDRRGDVRRERPALLLLSGDAHTAQGNVVPLMPRKKRKGRKGRKDAGEEEIRSVRCYLRVSTEEQAMFGYSLDAQRQELEEKVAHRGWRCVGWYVEEGRSAKDVNRPELQRMLNELQPGEVVMVLKLDRLTRSVRDLDELLKQFEKKQVLFKSASENFETVTASGRLFIRLVAEIAQWEREVIAERSAMGKRQKVEAGEWQGGPVPYGYKAVPSGQFKRGKGNTHKELLKLEPDEAVAHIVAEIFDLYRSGMGVRAICIHLNEVRKAKTKKGAKWRASTLIRLLQNPIYAGYVHHGERSKHGHETLWKRGSHQPLVTEEAFSAVQRAYELREGMAPRHATGQYPLTGVAYCGVCGGKIHILPRARHNSYSYRCVNYMNGVGCGGDKERSLTSAAGRAVEENLLAAMEAFTRPDGLSQYFTQLDQQQAAGEVISEAEIRRLEEQINRAQAAIRSWDQTMEESKQSRKPMSYDEYLDKVEPHQEAIRQAEEALAEERKKPAPPEREALAAAAVSIRQAWQHLQPPERKALLQQFCDAYRVKILVYPDRRVSLVPALAQ